VLISRGRSFRRTGRGPTLPSIFALLADPATVVDGLDLTVEGVLWLAPRPPLLARALRAAGVAVGPRVGVAYAGPVWSGRPWRFGWKGHPSLSRPFPAPATAQAERD